MAIWARSAIWRTSRGVGIVESNTNLRDGWRSALQRPHAYPLLLLLRLLLLLLSPLARADGSPPADAGGQPWPGPSAGPGWGPHLWFKHSLRIYLHSERPSETRPEIAMPMWSSILNTLRREEDSSDEERFSVATTTHVLLCSGSGWAQPARRNESASDARTGGSPCQACGCCAERPGSSSSQVGGPGRTFRPTAALPCLTASIAYSTWCRRPCGLQVVTSVSYCAAVQAVSALLQAARVQGPAVCGLLGGSLCWPAARCAALGGCDGADQDVPKLLEPTWLRNMAAQLPPCSAVRGKPCSIAAAALPPFTASWPALWRS